MPGLRALPAAGPGSGAAALRGAARRGPRGAALGTEREERGPAARPARMPHDSRMPRYVPWALTQRVTCVPAESEPNAS